MKKIAIVGEGYVGKAMKDFFADHFELVIIDIKYKEVAANGAVTANRPSDGRPPQTFSDKYADANGCDLVVISLPTPRSDEDGSCDTSLVEEALREIDAPLFLIKSTIEPGTTDRLKEETGKNIVFSPEFCGESRYWTEYKFHQDVKETPWFIFGGDSKDTKQCVEFFIKVVGPTKIYHQTEALVAELTKYVENTFFALKVTFCYEINELCERMGVDYYAMREAWLMDPRINPMHTAVFKESEKPFGGKCVPGDARLYVGHKHWINKTDQSSVSRMADVDIGSEGYLDIESLYNQFSNKYNGPDGFENYFALSANAGIDSLEFKLINDVTCDDFDGELYVFETDLGVFKCTPEHLMPVLRDGKMEIVQAQDVKESDEFFSMEIDKHFPEKGEVNDSEEVSNQEWDESVGSD